MTRTYSIDERTMRRVSAFVEMRRRANRIPLEVLAVRSGAGRNFRSLHHYISGRVTWPPPVAVKVLSFLSNYKGAKPVLRYLRRLPDGCYLDQPESWRWTPWWPSKRTAEELAARIARAEQGAQRVWTYGPWVPTWLLGKRDAEQDYEREFHDWRNPEAATAGLRLLHSRQFGRMAEGTPALSRTVFVTEFYLRFFAEKRLGAQSRSFVDAIERIIFFVRQGRLQFGVCVGKGPKLPPEIGGADEFTSVDNRLEFVKSYLTDHLAGSGFGNAYFNDQLMTVWCSPIGNESLWMYRELPRDITSGELNSHAAVYDALRSHLCHPLKPKATEAFLRSFIT